MSGNLTRIGYDARLALGNYRGMGRFLRLLIAGREAELIGLCAAGDVDPTLQLLAAGPQFYPIWEQAWLPWLALRERLQILICPYNTAPLLLPRRVKLVLVVHDLIFLDALHRTGEGAPLQIRDDDQSGRAWMQPLAHLGLGVQRDFEVV